MKMWIQLHDYSSKEMDGAVAEQATEALATFDWMSELKQRDQFKGAACDPGLGLVSDNGSILHICPIDEQRCCIHYHYDVRSKLLGFIPSSTPESHHIESCSYERAAELIGHHFNGHEEEILKAG
jgi:hypothetical protein